MNRVKGVGSGLFFRAFEVKLVTRKQGLWLLVTSMGGILLVAVLLHDLVRGDSIVYGDIDKAGIFAGLVLISTGLVLFLLDKFEVYEKSRTFSAKVYGIELLLVTASAVLLAVIVVSLHYRNSTHSPPGGIWSIGI